MCRLSIFGMVPYHTKPNFFFQFLICGRLVGSVCSSNVTPCDKTKEFEANMFGYIPAAQPSEPGAM